MGTQNKELIDESWGHAFFTMVDRKNADEYYTYFMDNGQVIFGNDPPIQGKEAIRQGLAQFYTGLESMHHEIDHLWVPAPNTVVNRATAHYVMTGGKHVDVPVVTIIDVAPGTQLVQKAQFYMDMTPLRN